MPTLRHLFFLLFPTIFTSPALCSAINLPPSHQSLSSKSSNSSETTTTTTSTTPTLPLANTNTIFPTPPTIPSHPPGTDPSYESTDIHLDSPTQTSSSEPIFQPSSELSFFKSDTPPSLPSHRPCTTTLTSTNTNTNNNNRPCPPPTWDGTLTSYPSTTTLFKPINCHGCMYVSVTEKWAVGCPNLHVSATVLASTASTTWREVCEGVVPLVTGGATRS